jgi:hypothetical protein
MIDCDRLRGGLITPAMKRYIRLARAMMNLK